ncbi:hypothetical protein NQZ79_g916 [Umbelopsis isabellina]|nr:hypothetical protein NQZ79_g916 [Umbelopsis isabellina]
MNSLEQLRQWIPSSEKLIKAAEENREIVAAVAGAVTLAGAVRLYNKRSKAPKLQGKSIKDVPGPKHWPLLGNALEFTQDSLVPYLEHLAWTYGEMTHMYIGPMRILVVSSPTVIDTLLRERPNVYKRSLDIERHFKDSNINGLFSMEGNQLNGFSGDEWRHSRAWLSPQFSPGKINKTRVLIAKHAIQLRKDLDQYSEDLETLQKKWFHMETPDPNARYTRSNFYNPDELKGTIDLFSSFAFSVVVDFSFAHDREDCLPENIMEDIKVLFSVMRRRLFGIVPWYRYGIKDADDYKFEATTKSLKEAVQRLIEEYDPKTYQDNSDKMSTMLESLWYSLNHKAPEQVDVPGMASVTKAAGKMSLDAMVGNLLTVISAGYGKSNAKLMMNLSLFLLILSLSLFLDTTANTLQAVSYMLAKHPHVQEKLYAEVDAVLGDPEARKNMTEEEIIEKLQDNLFAQFPYATAVVNETQRMHPVAPFAGMEALHDTVLDGYVIPKGTSIMAMTRVASMNYCPTPDPFQFKPERWIESTLEQRRQQDRLDWSFGGGPRVCPGRHMANLELVSAVVLVFSLYNLKQCDRAPSAPPVTEGARFTSTIENVYVRYIPRA